MNSAEHCFKMYKAATFFLNEWGMEIEVIMVSEQ